MPLIEWNDIDTVLLDMDGTLLDLNYDNVLWNERLPERYATYHGVTTHVARETLERHFVETRHTIEHYCLDYWARFTQLEHAVVASRADAPDPLSTARRSISRATCKASGRRAVLVTNAHRGGLAIKDEQTGLTRRLDHTFSSHDFRAPKESLEFWERLDAALPFDPTRTLFIDDNAAVLDAAQRHGVSQLLTVTQPDSGRPPRASLAHAAFNDFDEIMPS